jgi:hypothetical protein
VSLRQSACPRPGAVKTRHGAVSVGRPLQNGDRSSLLSWRVLGPACPQDAADALANPLGRRPTDKKDLVTRTVLAVLALLTVILIVWLEGLDALRWMGLVK